MEASPKLFPDSPFNIGMLIKEWKNLENGIKDGRHLLQSIHRSTANDLTSQDLILLRLQVSKVEEFSRKCKQSLDTIPGSTITPEQSMTIDNNATSLPSSSEDFAEKKGNEIRTFSENVDVSNIAVLLLLERCT